MLELGLELGLDFDLELGLDLVRGLVLGVDLVRLLGYLRWQAQCTALAALVEG